MEKGYSNYDNENLWLQVHLHTFSKWWNSKQVAASRTKVLKKVCKSLRFHEPNYKVIEIVVLVLVAEKCERCQ